MNQNIWEKFKNYHRARWYLAVFQMRISFVWERKPWGEVWKLKANRVLERQGRTAQDRAEITTGFTETICSLSVWTKDDQELNQLWKSFLINQISWREWLWQLPPPVKHTDTYQSTLAAGCKRFNEATRKQGWLKTLLVSCEIDVNEGQLTGLNCFSPLNTTLNPGVMLLHWF